MRARAHRAFHLFEVGDRLIHTRTGTTYDVLRTLSPMSDVYARAERSGRTRRITVQETDDFDLVPSRGGVNMTGRLRRARKRLDYNVPADAWVALDEDHDGDEVAPTLEGLEP